MLGFPRGLYNFWGGNALFCIISQACALSSYHSLRETEAGRKLVCSHLHQDREPGIGNASDSPSAEKVPARPAHSPDRQGLQPRARSGDGRGRRAHLAPFPGRPGALRSHPAALSCDSHPKSASRKSLGRAAKSTCPFATTRRGAHRENAREKKTSPTGSWPSVSRETATGAAAPRGARSGPTVRSASLPVRRPPPSPCPRRRCRTK